MQAIERKSQSTGVDAHKMINTMVIIGTICIILAFFYFWYFPFYVSNSISYLAKKMKELLQKTGIKLDTRTTDESFVLLHAIDLLENKLAAQKRRGKKVKPNRSLQQSPEVSSIAVCISRLNRLGCNGAAALLNSMLYGSGLLP